MTVGPIWTLSLSLVTHLIPVEYTGYTTSDSGLKTPTWRETGSEVFVSIADGKIVGKWLDDGTRMVPPFSARVFPGVYDISTSKGVLAPTAVSKVRVERDGTIVQNHYSIDTNNALYVFQTSRVYPMLADRGVYDDAYLVPVYCPEAIKQIKLNTTRQAVQYFLDSDDEHYFPGKDLLSFYDEDKADDVQLVHERTGQLYSTSLSRMGVVTYGLIDW